MTYFEDKAPNLAASIIALAVVAYMTFGLRVYTRIHNRAWGLDDWSMTLATVSHSLVTLAVGVMLTGRFPDSLHGPDNIVYRRCIQRRRHS